MFLTQPQTNYFTSQMKLGNTISFSFWPMHLHIFLVFSVNLLCVQLTAATNTPTNVTDQWALLKLKDSIANDPHKILSSWNSSLHFCKWHGITCSRRHQRVRVVDLHGYNLRGSIWPTACMVKSQRKLAVCFDCNISIFQATCWVGKFQPTWPSAPNSGS